MCKKRWSLPSELIEHRPSQYLDKIPSLRRQHLNPRTRRLTNYAWKEKNQRSLWQLSAAPLKQYKRSECSNRWRNQRWRFKPIAVAAFLNVTSVTDWVSSGRQAAWFQSGYPPKHRDEPAEGNGWVRLERERAYPQATRSEKVIYVYLRAID
jgi:hypothetical protein